MTHRASNLLVLLTSGILTGCAHLPDVTVHYYLATTDVTMSATRTVDCNGAGEPTVVTTFTPTVVQRADETSLESLKLSSLAGPLSDTDVKLQLYDDGRLQAINQTSTGEAASIAKSAASLVQAGVGHLDGIKVPQSTACDYIKTIGKDKGLVLNYEGPVDLSKAGWQSIPAKEFSKEYASHLERDIGIVEVNVERTSKPGSPADYSPRAGDVTVALRQPAWFLITARAGPIGSNQFYGTWNGRIQAGGRFGTPYSLPVPQRVAFGKEALSATFNDAGGLTSIEYSNSTGSGQSLDAATTVIPVFQSPPNSTGSSQH